MATAASPSFSDIFDHHKQPTMLMIVLAPHQIYAIGRVIVQWGAFDEQVDFLLAFWMKHPSVPPSLRKDRIWPDFKRRAGYLRALAEHILHEKADFLAEFNRGMSQAMNFKGKREWFAHGTFALTDNESPDHIRVTYKHHKFTLTVQQMAELADNIGLLTGWLMNFNWRVNEDVHRALHDRLNQLAAPSE